MFKNMFLVFFTLFIMLVTDARAAKLIVKITPENAEELLTQATVCEKETSVDARTVHKILDWSLENNDVSKQFLQCLGQHAKYVDGDGQLNTDKMYQYAIIEGSQEDYKNVVDECSKIIGKDLDSYYAMAACFFERVLVQGLDS